MARHLELPHVGHRLEADDGPNATVAELRPPRAPSDSSAAAPPGRDVGELLLSRARRASAGSATGVCSTIWPARSAPPSTPSSSPGPGAARRQQAALREEERRRIRRDLHDGLGAALAGLTFRIDAARNLSATDRDRAEELLAAATGQVRS